MSHLVHVWRFVFVLIKYNIPTFLYTTISYMSMRVIFQYNGMYRSHLVGTGGGDLDCGDASHHNNPQLTIHPSSFNQKT